MIASRTLPSLGVVRAVWGGRDLSSRSEGRRAVAPLPGGSGRGYGPSGPGAGEAEDGEAGEVDRGGQQGEVGGDLVSAADPGPASAVLAAHEVADLAFDLRAGGPPSGNPVDINGTDIVRVVDGKITEIYPVEELLKLTQQISTGAQPA